MDKYLKKDNIRCSLSDKSVSKRQKEQTSSDIFGSAIRYQEHAEKFNYDKDIESVDLIDIYSREYLKQYNNFENQGEKYKVRTAPSKDIARADDAEKIKENISYPSDNNYDGKSKKHDSKIEIIDCPKCGYKNLSNSNSCSFCGCDLTTPLKCPDCNYEISYNDTYCPYCGCDLSRNVLNAKFAVDQYNRLKVLLSVYLICIVILIAIFHDKQYFDILLRETFAFIAYFSPVVTYKAIKKMPMPKESGITFSVIYMAISSIIIYIFFDYIGIIFTLNAIMLCFYGYLNYLILTSKNPTNKINK